MFAFDTTFNHVPRSKRSPLLADFLRFNAKQSKHYEIGSAGEKLAVALFQDAGYKAWKPNYHGIDLNVVDRHTGELFTVEVKTATRSESRKSWQFCLNKQKNCSSCNAAYILLILIAETTVFTYLIPSEFLGKTKQFTICSHPEQYRGKLSPFRVRGIFSFEAANEIAKLSGKLQ